MPALKRQLCLPWKTNPYNSFQKNVHISMKRFWLDPSSQPIQYHDASISYDYKVAKGTVGGYVWEGPHLSFPLSFVTSVLLSFVAGFMTFIFIVNTLCSRRGSQQPPSSMRLERNPEFSPRTMEGLDNVIEFQFQYVFCNRLFCTDSLHAKVAWNIKPSCSVIEIIKMEAKSNALVLIISYQ